MKTFFTICLTLLTTAAAFGQIGSLDTTFGQGGKLTTLVTFVSGTNAIALQSDGKIVAAGYGFNGTTYEFAVARYFTDGGVDTTFGMEGIDTTRLRSGNSIATAVAIEPNGKIVLAGRSSNNSSDSTRQFALARYTANGFLDSTFGTNGIDTFYIGSSDDEANAMVIQPDGKILVAGLSNSGSGGQVKFALIRVDTSGALDITFNKTGKVLTKFGIYNARAYAIALQQDGKTLVGGFASDGTSRNFALARYDTSGFLDSLTFGKNGRATLDFWRNDDIIYSIAVQPNGRIVTGGTTSASSTNTFFALARFKTDGTPDSTFGDGPTPLSGRDTTHIYRNDDEIRSIAIDSIGRIVAAGFTINPNVNPSWYDFALTRYDSTGAIDLTFGNNNGKVITGFGSTNAGANAMVIQHDDKILLAGYSQNSVKGQFALARYNITIDTVTTVVEVAIDNTNSLFLYPNPVQDDALLNYTLTTNETITINIYDVTGRLVEPVITNQNKTAGSYEELLNLGSLPAGFYILNLSNANSQSLSIKLVKE